MQIKGTLLEFTKDMDQLFPSTSNVDRGAEKASMKQLSSRHKGRNARVSTKQKLMDSFRLDLNSNIFSEKKANGMCSAPPHKETELQRGMKEDGAVEEPEVKQEQDSAAELYKHCTGAQL